MYFFFIYFKHESILSFNSKIVLMFPFLHSFIDYIVTSFIKMKKTSFYSLGTEFKNGLKIEKITYL